MGQKCWKTLGERVSALVVCAAASGLACGGASGPAPEIYLPPSDAVVFQGQSARFAVSSSGTELSYQWLRNGHRIPGATGDVYETPRTEATDDGSAYSVVVVTKGGMSAESAAARLTVHPPLDLRFQWVGAPFAPRELYISGQYTGIQLTYYDATGSAMELPFTGCPSNCSFGYRIETAPWGMSVTYASEQLPPLPRVQWTAPDTVVTALAIEEGAGLSVAQRMQTDQVGAFSMEQGTVAPADLQDVATSEGLQGRVITAVSFWKGQVAYVSHGWTFAESAIYEAKVAFGQLEDVAALAEGLSAEGYVITGIGAGNGGANGFVLVGTRHQGQSAPRPLVAVRCTDIVCDRSPLDGYRVIARLHGATFYDVLVVGQK